MQTTRRRFLALSTAAGVLPFLDRSNQTLLDARSPSAESLQEKHDRVARMAKVAGTPTTPHLSGGFGFVYSLHFVFCVPEVGPWQEYTEGVKTYGQGFNPPLRITGGAISIPQGPGVGIADPKEVLNGA